MTPKPALDSRASFEDAYNMESHRLTFGLLVVAGLACGPSTRHETVDSTPPSAANCSTHRQAYTIAGQGVVCVSESYADLLTCLIQVNLKDAAVGTAAEFAAKASGKASSQGTSVETSADVEDKATRSLHATYGSDSVIIQNATARVVNACVDAFRKTVGLPPVTQSTESSMPTASASPTTHSAVPTPTGCVAGYTISDKRCCQQVPVEASFGWKQGPAVPEGKTAEIRATGKWTVVRESGPEGNGTPAGDTFLLSKKRGGVEGQLVVRDGSEKLYGMSAGSNGISKLGISTSGTLAFMANDDNADARGSEHRAYNDNRGKISVNVCYVP